MYKTQQQIEHTHVQKTILQHQLFNITTTCKTTCIKHTNNMHNIINKNTPTTSTTTCTKHTINIYTKSWTKPHQLEFMYRNATNVPTRVQKQ